MNYVYLTATFIENRKCRTVTCKSFHSHNDKTNQSDDEYNQLISILTFFKTK